MYLIAGVPWCTGKSMTAWLAGASPMRSTHLPALPICLPCLAQERMKVERKRKRKRKQKSLEDHGGPQEDDEAHTTALCHS
jgi:hypothetical protein